MAYTKQVGSRKEIGIRDDVFNSVEDALDYYNIVTTQYSQVKSYFAIEEPHKAILTCLNYGINAKIHRSVNLSKYLVFIRSRISTLTQLWIRSDLKALSDFLNLQASPDIQSLAKKIVEMDQMKELHQIPKQKEAIELDEKQHTEPSIDFSSFTGDQDFNKIGMQFVLASNIKALKGFIDILQEVSFPMTPDQIYQTHGDLEPIKKMVDDSMTIIEKLIEEGKAE